MPNDSAKLSYVQMREIGRVCHELEILASVGGTGGNIFYDAGVKNEDTSVFGELAKFKDLAIKGTEYEPKPDEIKLLIQASKLALKACAASTRQVTDGLGLYTICLGRIARF